VEGWERRKNKRVANGRRNKRVVEGWERRKRRKVVGWRDGREGG